MYLTKALAGTLPRKAPNTERHHATLNDLGRYKYAIYNIAPLDAVARHQLEASINSGEYSGKSSKLAPQPDFSNRSLRDVYNYHIHLRDEDDSIHPFYFIVADRVSLPEDGVLVVHLNSSMDEEDVVGVGRCGVDMADTWGGNLDIGNQDWLDLKEMEYEEWGGDNPYEDDSKDDAVTHEVGESSPGILTSRTATAQGLSSSGGTTKMVYGWYSLVEKGEKDTSSPPRTCFSTYSAAAIYIESMLDPEWLERKPGQSRFQMLGNFYSSTDPWTEIRASHPRQCVFRPNIHRTLILVAEQEDANQSEGVTIVRLDWDGDTNGVEDANPALKPEIEILFKGVQVSILYDTKNFFVKVGIEF
ncbi:hypothetical protein P153DRAFT_404995 [Dothidotthia symphoricarpi CBS 119687]|uniref:Uncharacterized protein n=1 Tax=Dothidotthia symphoricarpi CBS 119687 TaxID=1392245 RepID=A0A6A6ABW2_9PLEO|nr:uncharacterized protein P153DRAFT_404995 [Dothidotthia symphoricarpi CBS 119687]KAF2128713.1 hypothetical protein P153DRAFT_404995 [Dothidotthia symphoricarpi CBS 119687]